MAEIEFDEDSHIPSRQSLYRDNQDRKGLSGFFIKTGMAKDNDQAAKVMIVFAVIFFIIAFYILFRLFF